MSIAFISRACPSCNGVGCEQCAESGIIGSCEEVPLLPVRTPTQWSSHFRRWRISSGLTPRDVAKEVGMSPSEVSEIENGIIKPTMEQKRKLNRMKMLDRYRRRSAV